MIDGSRLPASTRLGRLLRPPLALAPKGRVVPVLTGRLRGAKWIIGSSPHGCWLGTYERQGQELAWRLASSKRVIYDIGANVGFFSLLFARAAPSSSVVVAFEPVPANAELLRRHLDLNDQNRVTVVEAALGNRNSRSRFGLGADRTGGRLEENGALEVDERTLDAQVFQHGLAPPDLMKLDTEGSEHAILSGAVNVFSNHSPVVWVETHGWQTHANCKDLLSGLGYRFEEEVETGASGHGRFVAVPASAERRVN